MKKIALLALGFFTFSVFGAEELDYLDEGSSIYRCTYRDAGSNNYSAVAPSQSAAAEAAKRACLQAAKVCFFAGCSVESAAE